jgi:hypothetical protein
MGTRDGHDHVIGALEAVDAMQTSGAPADREPGRIGCDGRGEDGPGPGRRRTGDGEDPGSEIEQCSAFDEPWDRHPADADRAEFLPRDQAVPAGGPGSERVERCRSWRATRRRIGLRRSEPGSRVADAQGLCIWRPRTG